MAGKKIKEKSEKAITLPTNPNLKRNWLKIRNAYNVSLESFGATISMMNEGEANAMYDLVKGALYKDNNAQIIKENPNLKEFLKNDEDRLCMIDIYTNLSWRLGKSEKAPKYRETINKFRLAVKKSLIP